MNKPGIITQARMSSTRLPGKVMLQIKGKTILQYHIERLQTSGIPVYVATSNLAADDAIADFCTANAYPFFRGDEQDVLSRFVGCASTFGLDCIVRVTSDCPLVDGQLIQAGVQEFLNRNDKYLYFSNGLTESYPRGFDYELFSIDALLDAALHASTQAQKEHVTPYLIENVSGKMKLENRGRSTDASQLRLTLDTAEDFQLIERLILDYKADSLSAEAIIELLEKHPELVKINAHIQQKSTHS